VRSHEPGLQGGLLVEAAERLGRIIDLGRRVREVVRPTIAATEGLFFVNLHPSELDDSSLYDPNAPFAAYAQRVIFEITERRSLAEITDLSARLARLREVGYRFALDDLGAGYAGLSSVADLAPDMIKLDMSLVRGVNQSATKQKLITSMASLARDLAVPLIAEGVETRDERRALLNLGCDYLQGYLFARPAHPLPQVPFDRLEAESIAALPIA
jgi:EAL domain-containing protein (putative c-di-GMP-specific phosphodiesterase class I)